LRAAVFVIRTIVFVRNPDRFGMISASVVCQVLNQSIGDTGAYAPTIMF